MVESQPIGLSSNWSTLGNADLRSILLENISENVEIDLQDVQIDNCVCLVKNDNNTSSKAELEIKVKGCITDIVLISEAQVIEVFGINDEYLLTHTAEFIDIWEDMAVYYAKITVPNIPVCKLKFTRSRNENRFWIYCAKIRTQKVINQPDSTAQFNLDQINRLMGCTDFSSLKNANVLNNVLQFYAKNLSHNEFGYSLGNIPGASNFPDCEKRKAQIVTELFSRLNIDKETSNGNEKICSKHISYEPYNSSWFVGYVDAKIHEIKNDVLNEIDARLAKFREETNHKLDKIITLLENQGVKTIEY